MTNSSTAPLASVAFTLFSWSIRITSGLSLELIETSEMAVLAGRPFPFAKHANCLEPEAADAGHVYQGKWSTDFESRSRFRRQTRQRLRLGTSRNPSFTPPFQRQMNQIAPVDIRLPTSREDQSSDRQCEAASERLARSCSQAEVIRLRDVDESSAC